MPNQTTAQRTWARPGLISAALVVAMVTSTVGAARAAGPEFLPVQDLPNDPTWVAGPIEIGEPDPEEFCVGHVIMEAGTRHRSYQTDLDTFARQHIMRATTDQAAARLQHRLDRAVRGCADAYEEEYPGSIATFKRYGRQEIGDSVAVFGVFVEDDFGALSANLFAVGRDGTAVTAVRYGRIGREADVPVRAFERTARRAVDHLRL